MPLLAAALMPAAHSDADVRGWLTGPRFPQTEDLPSHLQTRWVDASQLPSRPLDPAADCDGGGAGGGELSKCYLAVAAGCRADDIRLERRRRASLERAPAWRWSSRPGGAPRAATRAGDLAGVDRRMLTGDLSDAGQCYLVRDVYCEPALGHSAQRLVDGLDRAYAPGPRVPRRDASIQFPATSWIKA